MEREYKKSPTLNLQTHLITYGSEMAVDDYVKQVMRDMFPPEKDKTLSDGPTAAISTLHDCKFLPQLESLLIVKMDSSFSDCTWHSLSNALITAFANCGINSKGVAIEIIEKHRPSANEDEKNYRYCNYVIEEIKRIARLQEDRAYSLADTKKICQQLHLLISLSLAYQFILLQTFCHWHFTKNFQTYCIKTVANSYSFAYNNSEP